MVCGIHVEWSAFGASTGFRCLLLLQLSASVEEARLVMRGVMRTAQHIERRMLDGAWLRMSQRRGQAVRR